MISTKNNSEYIEKITEQEPAEGDWLKFGSTTLKGTPKNINVQTGSTTTKIITSTSVTQGEDILITKIDNSIVEGIAGVVTGENINSSSLDVNDIFGDNSAIATYTLDNLSQGVLSNANISGPNNGVNVRGTFAPGLHGNCLVLTKNLAGAGNNGFDIPSHVLSNRTTVTFSFNVFRENNSDPIPLIGFHYVGGQRGIAFHIIGTNSANYYLDGGTVTPNTLKIYNAGSSNADGGQAIIPCNFPVQEWFNIQIEFDGANNKKKLYINGVFKGEATNPVWSKIPNLAVNGGGSDIFSVGYYKYQGICGGGRLDQIRLFNKILTETERNIIIQESSAKYEIDITSLGLNEIPIRAFQNSSPEVYIDAAMNKNNLFLKNIPLTKISSTTTEFVGTTTSTLGDDLVKAGDKIIVDNIETTATDVTLSAGKYKINFSARAVAPENCSIKSRVPKLNMVSRTFNGTIFTYTYAGFTKRSRAVQRKIVAPLKDMTIVEPLTTQVTRKA